jgi:diphthamide synthase (EF-2-diphthine--ammonia ligase)
LLFFCLQEDEKLAQLVALHGVGTWAPIAAVLTGRAGKQCRERWVNHLDPAIRREPWTLQEDEALINAVGEHGEHWSLVSEAPELRGRPEGSVKNRCVGGVVA